MLVANRIGYDRFTYGMAKIALPYPRNHPQVLSLTGTYGGSGYLRRSSSTIAGKMAVSMTSDHKAPVSDGPTVGAKGFRQPRARRQPAG
jgi:hypothetical protein